MTPETVFQLANALVLPQWLLMLAAPRWRVTQAVVRSFALPALLAVIYATYLFSGKPVDFSAFGSLSGIKTLFATGGDAVMLAGWVHYLAFDLVAGSTLLLNAQREKIPHWLIVIPLLFCFMLGPVGWLIYWIIRLVRTRTVLFAIDTARR
jgi:hypothetical protein